MALVSHNFSDIWSLGAKDVHPVLYYFLLKIINLIFGSNILIYRLISVLPIAILSIIGFTHIRKDFGERTGLLFSFFVTMLPVMSRYATEIRMYSCAILFVTITAIYAYRLYKRGFSIKNLIIFGIFSLCSAYTHYYGLMAVGLINLTLFIYLVKNCKEKKNECIKFIICAIVQVLLYLPWLLIFLRQFNTISSNGYWITMSFPNTLFEIVGFQFAGKIMHKYLALACMVVMYTYIGYLIYKTKKENEDMKPAILAIVIYLGVIIAAYIISKIRVPILFDRYLLVITGLLAFFLAFFMAKEKNKYITIGICTIIFVISLVNQIALMIINYSPKNTEMIEYLSSNLQEDDSFLVYNGDLSGYAITVRYPDKMNYYYDRWNIGASGTYDSYGPNLLRTDSLDEIMSKVSGRIWIINISKEDLENEIKNIYDIDIIERREFQTLYNGYFFSFTLIEK